MDYAVTSALEEIIERHATMVWWLNGHPIDATDPADLARLWDSVPAEAGQRPSLIMIDNEFSVPVAAGVLHNDVDTLVNVGLAHAATPPRTPPGKPGPRPAPSKRAAATCCGRTERTGTR